MASRVSLERTVNEVLAPYLLSRGFTIAGSKGGRSSWAEGRYFRRLRSDREDVIFLGRDKFGQAVSLNIARQKQDGSYAYMDWHNRGLTRERLKYSNQQDLDELLKFLLWYFDGEIVPWLESMA